MLLTGHGAWYHRGREDQVKGSGSAANAGNGR